MNNWTVITDDFIRLSLKQTPLAHTAGGFIFLYRSRLIDSSFHQIWASMPALEPTTANERSYRPVTLSLWLRPPETLTHQPMRFQIQWRISFISFLNIVMMHVYAVLWLLLTVLYTQSWCQWVQSWILLLFSVRRLNVSSHVFNVHFQWCCY